jgi:hypothetical protein
MYESELGLTETRVGLQVDAHLGSMLLACCGIDLIEHEVGFIRGVTNDFVEERFSTRTVEPVVTRAGA